MLVNAPSVDPATTESNVVALHPELVSYGQIWVKFRKEGVHAYYDALTNPALADVSFLGHPHRHIFWFKVWIDVYHNDRDLEFIQFKRWLESLYSNDTLQLDGKSCEMLADELANHITAKYPGRSMSISVSEDDENGCLKVYDPR